MKKFLNWMHSVFDKTYNLSPTKNNIPTISFKWECKWKTLPPLVPKRSESERKEAFSVCLFRYYWHIPTANTYLNIKESICKNVTTDEMYSVRLYKYTSPHTRLKSIINSIVSAVHRMPYWFGVNRIHSLLFNAIE